MLLYYTNIRMVIVLGTPTIADERYVKEIELLKNNPITQNIPYGFLSDEDIILCINNQAIFIDSIDDRFDYKNQIRGASIDLRLGTKARYIKDGLTVRVGDKKDEGSYSEFKEIDRGYLSIKPNETVLVNTMERLLIPADMLGILSGRSSIARMGLMIHCCQSFIVPGHIQNVPLQLTNLTKNVIEIEIGSSICQLSLVHLHTPSSTPYYSRNDAKYVTERQDPIPSRQSLDIKSNVSVTHKPQKKRKRIIPLWLHNFMYHPLFVGILGGVLASLVFGQINLFSSQSFNMSGTFILVVLGLVLLIGYIIDFITYKNK